MALLLFSTSFCAASSYFSASVSSPSPSLGCRNLIISCSSGKERAHKRAKVLRSIKSIEDLCNDIREFKSMVGLPEDSVPRVKDFSQHGRKDLANHVRRRGYKLIAEHLLELYKCDSNIQECSKSVLNTTEVYTDVEGVPLINCDPFDGYQDDLIENWHNDPAKCVRGVSDSSDDIIMRENISANGVAPISSSILASNSVEPSISLSLREKAANFVHNGDLDALEGTMEMPEIHIVDPGDDVPSSTDDRQIGNYHETIDEVVGSGRTNGNSIFSGDNLGSNFITTSELVITQSNRSLDRYNHLLSEGQSSADLDWDLASEERSWMNLIEIDRIKGMLCQKELELSQLKKQIGYEKLALSILLNKAKTEIGNIQKLISEKDAELLAGEESLAGLREVEIAYHGMGETVEVAGSFNGWLHRIKMDPSSETETAMLWSTVIWLYPGVYEIKFIVDGRWKIDSKKECTTSQGCFQNNILRVDR